MIILDGGNMTDRASIHAELKEKLHLPEYYGNNLDALYDCLTERQGGELIVLNQAGDFLEACGDYGAALLRVLLNSGRQVLLG